MASRLSDPSVVSMKSQRIMEDIAKKSCTRIYKLNGLFDDEDIRTAWNGFGLYISRQLRMGRAVVVPGYGSFSFSAPEVNLNGVTNPNVRDKQYRIPVFIVSKDFVKGMDLQSAIGTAVTIRPYAVHGSNGRIAQTKVNFTEIGCYCNKTKDQAKTAVDRVIKHLSDEARTKGSVDMEIPNVGTFRVRGNLAAVTFNDFLTRDAMINTDLHKSIKEKKQGGESNLTKETIQNFANMHLLSQELRDKDDQFLEIDPQTKHFLKSDMAIDIDNKFNRSLYAMRPNSCLSARISLPNSPVANNFLLHTAGMKSNQLQPLSTTKNKTLKNFDRVAKSENQTAFRQLTLWIRAQQLCPQDAFKEFCRIVHNSKKADPACQISPDQLYTGLQKIGLKVTAVQA